MLHLIEQAISAYSMLNGTKEITVALSGGADSVALLHAMLALRENYGCTIYAAHLNHALRGQESDADAAFVAALCKDWNVQLFSEKTDVAVLAAQQGQSIELAARNARYAFLQRVAKGKIATAHTADDNAETVLFHIARGTALTGVCGIPPVRDNVIRPLIFCTRVQVEAYCKANALSYQTDSTNTDQRYTRNRIRHAVLPQLKKINSGCVPNISRMSEALRADADYLDSIAESTYASLLSPRGLPAKELNELHPALLSRLLVLHCKNRTGQTPDAHHLQCMHRLLKRGTRTQLSGSVFAVKSGGFFDFDTVTESSELCVCLGDNFQTLQFKGMQFSFGKISSKKVNNFVFNNSFDCDKIKGKLVIRHRLQGDTLCPVGRGCTKTLRKLFNEAGLPLSARSTCRILADDIGIVWVEGFGVAERVCLSADTKQFVTVKTTEETLS